MSALTGNSFPPRFCYPYGLHRKATIAAEGFASQPPSIRSVHQIRAWHEIASLPDMKLTMQMCILAAFGGCRVVNFVPGTKKVFGSVDVGFDRKE